jgi:hypothetical protein
MTPPGVCVLWAYGCDPGIPPKVSPRRGMQALLPPSTKRAVGALCRLQKHRWKIRYERGPGTKILDHPERAQEIGAEMEKKKWLAQYHPKGDLWAMTRQTAPGVWEVLAMGRSVEEAYDKACKG